MSGGYGGQLKAGCLRTQVVGLAGVEFQAIQAAEVAGASEDEAMDQGGESDGDDSGDGSDGANLYEEGNDVRGCSSCQAPASCCLRVCVHELEWPTKINLQRAGPSTGIPSVCANSATVPSAAC